MNNKQIRLTESDLQQIVKESVNKILKEAYGTPSSHDYWAAQSVNDIDFGGQVAGTKQEIISSKIDNEIKSSLFHALRGLNEIEDYTKNNSVDLNLSNYINSIRKKLYDTIAMCRMAKNKLVMNIGQIPA